MEVTVPMNLIEVAAMATIALGEIVILIALSCAILSLGFNIINSLSLQTSPNSSQIMIIGWLGFLTVVGGLVIAFSTGVSHHKIGLAFGMTIGIKAFLLLVIFLLLSFGRSWRLSTRHTGK